MDRMVCNLATENSELSIEYNSQLTKVCDILNCVMGYGVNGKR